MNIFKKIISKLVKKAVKKTIEVTVENPNLTVPATESEVNVNNAQEPSVKPKDPLWVIVLKVLAYIIGLILGGVATTSCASALM